MKSKMLFLCEKDETNLKQLTHKRVGGIIRCRKARGDEKWRELESGEQVTMPVFVHEDCRKEYIRFKTTGVQKMTLRKASIFK